MPNNLYSYLKYITSDGSISDPDIKKEVSDTMETVRDANGNTPESNLQLMTDMLKQGLLEELLRADSQSLLMSLFEQFVQDMTGYTNREQIEVLMVLCMIGHSYKSLLKVPLDSLSDEDQKAYFVNIRQEAIRRVTINGESPAEGEELEERVTAFNSGHYIRACGWDKIDIVKNMLPDNIDWEDEELKEIIERFE